MTNMYWPRHTAPKWILARGMWPLMTGYKCVFQINSFVCKNTMSTCGLGCLERKHVSYHSHSHSHYDCNIYVHLSMYVYVDSYEYGFTYIHVCVCMYTSIRTFTKGLHTYMYTFVSYIYTSCTYMVHIHTSS